MFSHTSRSGSRIWRTSVRKQCFFCCCSFQWFVVVVFLLVVQWFWAVLGCFYWFYIWFCFVLGVPPLVFHYFVSSRNGFGRKTKGKLLENQSQPTPGPLRSFLLGLSRLCLLWGSFSGTSLESLLAGLLWAPLAGSAPLLPLSVFFYA